MTHSITHDPFAQMAKDDGPPAEINMSKIPVSGDVAGLVFAAATVIIFFSGHSGDTVPVTCGDCFRLRDCGWASLRRA